MASDVHWKWGEDSRVAKGTPLCANHGFHHRTWWAGEVDTKSQASKFYAHCMQSVVDFPFENSQITWANMSYYCDNKHLLEPKYKVGDLVILDTRNIKTKLPTSKTAPKSFSHFPVTLIVTRTCYLDLGAQWNIFPVFHISLLESYRKRARPSQKQDLPPLRQH